LQQLLAKARRTDTVAIVHVGLTMTEAWDYVRELLFDESSKPVNVDYRLLILADSSGKQSGWPAEVADWAQSVPASIAMIQRDLARAAELFKRRGQTLRFSVRQYDEVPVVHGWAIKQPLQAWHVGHCRWRGESYDWGGQNYVEIVGSSDDPLTQDIAELFDSYFDHLWLGSREVAELSYPREQATAA
jgi:hypothetical protein